MDDDRRKFLLSGAALAAASLAGCDKPRPAPVATDDDDDEPAAPKPKPAPPPPPLPDVVHVRLKTEKGDIVLELEAKKAPITVANFLHYIQAHKYDGAHFWRASKSGPTNGFIQTSPVGATFPPIAHESTKVTGLSHTNGAISMSRYDVGTATGDFIIVVGDLSYLDAGHDPKGDNQGYAVFGHVTEGMDVVRAILHGKIDKHTPEGGWKGEQLAAPVGITTATRVD